MPKRVIDGDGVWLSDKLRKVPEKVRPEFANLVPLALANGSFECDALKIWARVYAYNRPDVTVQFVEEALEAFERAKMLFRWKDDDGKTWGFWVGIDKPGRLPSGTDQKHGAKGVIVPREALQSFLSNGIAAIPVNGESNSGQTSVVDRSGFGSGLGSGSGKGPLAEKRSRTRVAPPAPPLFSEFWSRYPVRRRGDESRAIREFVSLSEAEQMQAIESLAAFKDCDEWQERGGRMSDFIVVDPALSAISTRFRYPVIGLRPDYGGLYHNQWGTIRTSWSFSGDASGKEQLSTVSHRVQYTGGCKATLCSSVLCRNPSRSSASPKSGSSRAEALSSRGVRDIP